MLGGVMPHCVSLMNWTPDQVVRLMEFAKEVKTHKDRYRSALFQKTLGMIFEKPSTRTRISFAQAMVETGGYPLSLSKEDLQLRRGESLEDTARVLSRYIHGIMIRTFEQEVVESLAEHASIPVINGLTDRFHPCQALTDAFTIYEHYNHLEGVHLAYVGDGNNVAHSLLLVGALTGMAVTVITPKAYAPKNEIVQQAKKHARLTGATIVVTDDLEAMEGADVVYTDTWVSMGQDEEAKERKRIFRPYQVNTNLMKKASKKAIFMHCLPCHRGEEVTAEVIDGPQSVVFDQAENRLHTQKALLITLMG